VEKNKVLTAVSSSNGSLWEFALHVYAEPAIEQHSLQLQDEYNANVNIILWCCWLEMEGIELSVNWLDDVLITIDSVSLQTVAKLREVRRMLVESGSFTKVQALSIKKHIMNAELMIEKVLIQRLQDLTCRFIESRELEGDHSDKHCLDLEYYLTFIGVHEPRKNAGLMLNACRRLAFQSS